MWSDRRISNNEVAERIKELLNSQPTLKQAFESQGWEGLEAFSGDPVAEELLEWKLYLS
ncbi:hypothetical protein [Thermovibrio sp.]